MLVLEEITIIKNLNQVPTLIRTLILVLISIASNLILMKVMMIQFRTKSTKYSITFFANKRSNRLQDTPRNGSKSSNSAKISLNNKGQNSSDKGLEFGRRSGKQ